MLMRTRLILSAAVVAALSPIGLNPSPARAAEGESARDHVIGLTPPTVAPDPQSPLVPSSAEIASRRPLMGLLEEVGVARQLDEARIQVYGHVEGSYTYNFAGPPTSLADYKLPVGKFIDNPGRVFDVENQKILLNQLTLNVERTVDVTQGAFDVGGRVELLYGADGRFIHSNGLLDNYDDDATSRVTGGPQNHFDIPQAYLDFAIPVGNGLRVRAGKFTFFKTIDPNASVFYSHSFTFGAALPFTLTGAYATYVLDEKLSVDAGFSRGWDQSLNDNNDAIDAFGRVRYAVGDDWLLSLAAITGPEQDGDNGNYRTALDFTVTWQTSESLTLLADVVYGQQSQPVGGGGDARWYGISLYAVQRLDEMFSVGARLEWYRDEGGYTTGLDQNLYEATVGVTITPFPDDTYLRYLKIRPEVRIDYSSENYFDGFDSHTQVTAAIDAIYNF